MLAIESPYPQFFDLDGRPLDAGYVYIGVENQNPETSPLTVYWDAELTQPAAQPLRTKNGMLARNGKAAPVYVAVNHSMTVRNCKRMQVVYARSSQEFNVTAQVDLLRSDLASSSTGKGANLITIPPRDLNYVSRTLQEWANDTYSVKNAGAKGDGSTDDTAAVQKAADVAALWGRALYFPQGDYRLLAQIIATGRIAIIGESRANTRLVWSSGAVSEGLLINLGGANGTSDMAEVYRLQLVSGNTLAAGTALRIVGSNTYSSDRYTSRAVVRDVVCRNLTDPFTDGWRVGVELDNCTNSLVDCVNFWGKIGAGGEPDYTSVSGIVFNGTATIHAVAVTITNCWVAYAQAGIRLYDFEGALIRGNQVLGVNTGLVVDNPDPGGFSYPHCSVLDNHFNASAAGVTLNRTAQALVHNNLIYTQLGASIGAGITVLGNSDHFSIQGNIFENVKQAYAMNCIVVESGTSGLIEGNIIRRADSVNGTQPGLGVWLAAGSSGCQVGSNLYSLSAQTVLDEGSDNKVLARGGAAGQLWSTDPTGGMRQWGSSVVTLNASGDGSITLPRAFNGTHIGTVCNGDPLAHSSAVFSFNQSLASGSSLAFSVRPSPGAVSVRVNYQTQGAV